jgi:hypothetical protein
MMTRLVRTVLSISTRLLTGGTTREVIGPEEVLLREGFRILWSRRNWLGNFFWLAAQRPGEV